MPLQPVGVELNAMSLRGVESLAPGRMDRVGGNGHNVLEQFRFFNGPFQQLLAAHGSAETDPDFFNAQHFAQGLIGPDHIPGSKKREVVIEGLAGFRIVLQRASASITTSRHIYANQEVFLRIYHRIRANQSRPPFNRVAVCGECMKYPYHVGMICIQLSVNVICQLVSRQHNAGLQRERVRVRKDFWCQ